MSSTNKKIRVLICNKYALFRLGIKALLREQSPFTIVGETSTARGAIKQAERLRPDVVLMGEAIPDWSSAEATRCIKANDPDVKVLVLSLDDDETLISRCLEAGASGYLSKNDGAAQLQNAIDAVCNRSSSERRLKAFVA
jgi:DNA-binding NarL/FixJ family response regulator